MDIKREYYLALNDLYKSTNGLLAYTLHTKHHFTPTNAVDFINTFKEEGWISLDDEYRIKLTDVGKRKLIQEFGHYNPQRVYAESGFRSEVRTNFRIMPFEPYMPKMLFTIRVMNNHKF